jgi:hypothetical protein
MSSFTGKNITYSLGINYPKFSNKSVNNSHSLKKVGMKSNIS